MVTQLDAAHKAAAMSSLKQLAKADEEKRARESAKNALEAYIYATREKLDGADSETIEAAAGDGVVQSIREGLTDAEEWLYDDGATATTAEYKARLATVRAPADPVFNRVAEAADRPKLVNDTRTFLTTARDIVSGWVLTHPQITANETADAVSSIDKFEAWFNETLKSTEEASPTKDPLLTRDAVAVRRKPIADTLLRLSRKPKPTPTPTPKASINADDLYDDEEEGDDEGDASAEPAKSTASKKPATPAPTSNKNKNGKTGGSTSTVKGGKGDKADSKAKASSPTSAKSKATPSRARGGAPPAKDNGANTGRSPSSPPLKKNHEDRPKKAFAEAPEAEEDADFAFAAEADETADSTFAQYDDTDTDWAEAGVDGDAFAREEL